MGSNQTYQFQNLTSHNDGDSPVVAHAAGELTPLRRLTAMLPFDDRTSGVHEQNPCHLVRLSMLCRQLSCWSPLHDCLLAVALCMPVCQLHVLWL
jgi:hypothetical protein